MPGPADPLLTLDQAAGALGTGPDYPAALIASGHIDYVRDGDQIRIPERALIAHVLDLTAPATVAEIPVPQQISATEPDTHSIAYPAA